MSTISQPTAPRDPERAAAREPEAPVRTATEAGLNSALTDLKQRFAAAAPEGLLYLHDDFCSHPFFEQLKQTGLACSARDHSLVVCLDPRELRDAQKTQLAR